MAFLHRHTLDATAFLASEAAPSDAKAFEADIRRAAEAAPVLGSQARASGSGAERLAANGAAMTE